MTLLSPSKTARSKWLRGIYPTFQPINWLLYAATINGLTVHCLSSRRGQLTKYFLSCHDAISPPVFEMASVGQPGLVEPNSSAAGFRVSRHSALRLALTPLKGPLVSVVGGPTS